MAFLIYYYCIWTGPAGLPVYRRRTGTILATYVEWQMPEILSGRPAGEGCPAAEVVVQVQERRF